MMFQTPNSDLTRNRYNRLAFWYDIMEAPMERFRFASWRERLRDRIVGNRVLEVGVGTGKNLSYYPQGIKVTAIDLSPLMLEGRKKGLWCWVQTWNCWRWMFRI